MASLNKTLSIGRAAKDPEIKQFQDGNKIATFTLAVSETYTDRQGQRKENTEWLNVVLGGKLADVAERFIHKGSQIYLEGKIRTRSWDDQNGQKHSQTEILGINLQLLDPKPQTQPQQPQFSQPTYSTQSQTPPQPGYQPPYGAVAQPPRQRRQDMSQQLDPANYPDDLPFN